MGTVLLILYIVTCLFLIPVILLQAGKGGGGMGAAFGGGGSGSVFGGRGASTFLTRATSVMAALFMVLSVLLTLVNYSDDLQAAGKKGKPGEFFEWLDKSTKVEPVKPEDSAKPAEAPKPDAAKPATAPKVELKPGVAPKVELKPATAPKAEVKPVEAPKPAEVKPAEAPKPAEVKPAEAPKPVEPAK